MSCLNNSFDYNVNLLGLLPVDFDFSKEENNGVRFQTDKLKKVRKPSEDHHDGQVIISDAHLLESTAVAEAKIIRHKNPTMQQSNRNDVSEEEGEATPIGPAAVINSKGNINGASDQDGEAVASANESVQNLKIEDRPGDDVKEQTRKDESSKSVSDESTETSTEAAQPVDKILKNEYSVRFLYKSYYNVGSQKPDFVSYRLPLMFLAIKTDPYFFKVNKIRFKPYGCENEMEFIQIRWPIQLDQLYKKPYDISIHNGWSGPMFNKWATTDESRQEKTGSRVESAPTSHVEDAKGDGNEIDSSSSCNYHRAYIRAELKPKSECDSTRGFSIIIAALVGGVWNLEEDPENYTCKHLAEMRTAKEEILRENRPNRYNSNSQDFFYKRVRMLSNYWQCYLAGETNYLVGFNGPTLCDPSASKEATMKGREIKELRLYDVSKIPGFIKKCGAEQGFHPWSKEILQNRLYKSLSVIYDKVIDAPVDAEFMFVKYNEFDPPVHDVDGSITGPYLLAFRQIIIEGLPTPSQPKLVINLIKFSKYPEIVHILEDRKFTLDDLPKIEDKESYILLTFTDESLADFFLHRVDSMLKYMKDNNKFPADFGMENLSVKQVFMEKPEPPHGNNSKSWRSANRQQQQYPLNNSWNNGWKQGMPTDDSQQSWRNSNHQQLQSNPPNEGNSWRRGGDRTGDNFRSWRNSSYGQHQQSNQSNHWNNNRRQEDATANFREHGQPRNIDDDGRRQHYGRRVFTPDSEKIWRQK